MAIVASLVCAGVLVYDLATNSSVRSIAASQIGCPESQVTVTAESGSNEFFHVEGCGRVGTLVCTFPDPSCLFIGGPGLNE